MNKYTPPVGRSEKPPVGRSEKLPVGRSDLLSSAARLTEQRSPKQELRKKFSAARLRLSPQEHQQKSLLACQNLAEVINSNPDITSIAIYYPANFELDILNLINLLEPDKKFFLPRVIPDSRQLLFLEFDYKNLTNLEKNQFGILEPMLTAQAAQDLDLIIAPLVAFSENFCRLGHGCGFYDFTLGEFLKSQPAKIPVFAGVAFDCQCFESNLPEDPWDIKIDIIATESRILYDPTKITAQYKKLRHF